MTHNTIHCIGFSGDIRCYLNIPLDEAMQRYCDEEGYPLDELDNPGINCFSLDINDQFTVSSIWAHD